MYALQKFNLLLTLCIFMCSDTRHCSSSVWMHCLNLRVDESLVERAEQMLTTNVCITHVAYFILFYLHTLMGIMFKE